VYKIQQLDFSLSNISFVQRNMYIYVLIMQVFWYLIYRRLFLCMRKKVAIFLCSLLLFLPSCRKKTETGLLQSHQKWLNQSYIDIISHRFEINDSCLPPVFGIEFYRDSATVFTPSDIIAMAVRQNKDSLFLIDIQRKEVFAFKKTSVSLNFKTRNSESILTPYNGRNTIYDEFALRVNKVLFAGNYTLLSDNKVVKFSATGKITGLKPYSFYAPCLGGFCMKVPKSKSNLIWMGDSVFGYYYSWDRHADTLILYSLASRNTAEDNSYYRLNVKFKLLKDK
jgi:hypothetical protein